MSYLPFAPKVSAMLKLKLIDVKAVLELLSEGSTIPFIARYRKDTTGGLDEVQIQAIQENAKFEKEFSERKEFIEKVISEQGKMTEELQKKINATISLAELEDIYLPFKPKRKTKAQTARENGLEPLAQKLFTQEPFDPFEEAKNYIQNDVKSIEEALQGARDIIAEMVNEDAVARAKIRRFFEETAIVYSTLIDGKESEAIKYKDYYSFSESVSKIPSHRILAIFRGFMDGFLKLEISPLEEIALEKLESQFIIKHNEASQQVKKAIRDAYRRMLKPSLESEIRSLLKNKSDEDAINVFAENLRQLLLSSPLGPKRILAIDPGYRTGCKVVCLDETGSLLKTDLIFIHEKNTRLLDAETKIKSLFQQFSIQAFAIGDGTAGRETEQFIKSLQLNVPVFLVNEDGASIYSASIIAREEFPDQDITVRGSVSIGRRLLDPLAELVKIDPKSIGVGQYQHDVNQVRLKEKLDQTVESCVNKVGVNLNTASKHLLSYVSGIGPSIAENIIQYRKEIGSFKNRKQLLKVARLGSKAYEQCAGFLRVKDGDNPLDASAVHPESYKIVEQMAVDLKLDVAQLIGNEEQVKKINPQDYVDQQLGLLSIQDILKELKKPGLDPRADLQTFEFASIFAIEDVAIGMVIPGVVTNITRFGAFVDIGVKQDGLVHVSEIAQKYISDPNEVLKLNQQVMVKVTDLDIPRKRIALSIKQVADLPSVERMKNNKPSYKVIKNHNPTTEVNINEALNALKKKFGK
jgi:uncharacterized protein